MMVEVSAPQPSEDESAIGNSANGPQSANRIGKVFLAIQVRLRFVVVLGVAFLIVGLWGNLRDVWDTWQHRWFGSHSHQAKVSTDTEYFCPMCPGVISDWPAICPVCSMDLIRRKKGDATLLPEGVVARMQLSPYRIQLAGISTTVLENRPLSHEITLAGRMIARLPSGDQAPADHQVLVLECPVTAGDLSLLAEGQVAGVLLDNVGQAGKLSGVVEQFRDSSPLTARRSVVSVRLTESPAWARPGMPGTARISVPLNMVEPFAMLPAGKSSESAGLFTAVPESAVVDTGARRVVFVETMPGMFDGVEVTLGPRCGDYYPVISGLESGQKVATTGAFLIDAEARLSPDLAAAYFGAARTSDPAVTGMGSLGSADSRKPQAGKKSKKSGTVVLSAADEKLAREQKICPVTEFELDSMGGPIPIEVAGKRVFICCKGCEQALRGDPQKYLAKLKK